MKRDEAIKGLKHMGSYYPYDSNLQDIITALSSPCACGGAEPIAQLTGWLFKEYLDHPAYQKRGPNFLKKHIWYGPDPSDTSLYIPVRVIILPGEQPDDE